MSANDVATNPRTSAKASRVFMANSVKRVLQTKATLQMLCSRDPRSRLRKWRRWFRGSPFRCRERNPNRERENGHDDEEGDSIRNREMGGDDHFCPYEKQD